MSAAENHVGKSVRKDQTEGAREDQFYSPLGWGWGALELEWPQLERGGCTFRRPQQPVTGHGLPSEGSVTADEDAPAEARSPGQGVSC